uniref:Uncharacterized protein n=1 Tax=Amphiprion percula TaxID=161767 RepID=A0A3P8T6Z1_AMPPE
LSSTFISISDVPVFGGEPPSTAVNSSCIFGFFSRSNAFCNTNSGDTLSPRFCVARLKYSFGLSNTISIVLCLKTNPPLCRPCLLACLCDEAPVVPLILWEEP